MPRNYFQIFQQLSDEVWKHGGSVIYQHLTYKAQTFILQALSVDSWYTNFTKDSQDKDLERSDFSKYRDLSPCKVQ
jgi:hypothetical protein